VVSRRQGGVFVSIEDLRESMQLMLLEIEAVQNRLNDLRDVAVGTVRILNELHPRQKTIIDPMENKRDE
jgi:hypothetical protein